MTFMNRISLTAALAALAVPVASANAAVLVSYDFAGATDNAAVALTVDRPTATLADNPGGTLAAITTEFTRASEGTSGLYDNEADGGGSSTNFQMKGSSGTQTPSVAIANNAYFEFTVNFSALAPGQEANLTSLNFIAARSGATERGFFITTNGPADGFGYDAPSDAGYGNTTAGTTFVSFDKNVDSQRTTTAGTGEFTAYSLDLTGSDFQNLTSDVTFRLYATSDATGGTVQFDDFVLNGDVVAIPEPASLALLGLGGLCMLGGRRRRA